MSRHGYFNSILQRLWILCIFFLPIVAAATTDDATLQVGRADDRGVCGGADLILSGYSSGTYGSYSPTGLTGGKTVTFLIDINCGTDPVGSELSISGFSANPGQAWLTSATCHGVTLLSSAATFSYSGGVATWAWDSIFGLGSLTIGTDVSCAMSHS